MHILLPQIIAIGLGHKFFLFVFFFKKIIIISQFRLWANLRRIIMLRGYTECLFAAKLDFCLIHACARCDGERVVTNKHNGAMYISIAFALSSTCNSE